MQLQAVPGQCVGPLQLGAPLASVMAALRSLSAEISAAASIRFIVDKQNSSNVDIVLDAPLLGICCRIHPREQTLRAIELYNFTPSSGSLLPSSEGLPAITSLSVSGHELASLRSIPTLQSVFKRLGPTYPGCFVKEKDEFILAYPGLAIIFPIPPNSIPTHDPSKVSTDLLLSTAKSQPVASRIYIFNASVSATSVSPDFLSIAEPPLLPGRAAALIHAVPGKGVTFPETGGSISFGTPAQDVLCILGTPSDIFIKTVNGGASTIGFGGSPVHGGHAVSPAIGVAAGAGNLPAVTAGGLEVQEYAIWNYFHLGMDVVMDCDDANASVARIVFHANLPTHHSFGRYVKARFRMLLSHDGDRGQLIDASSSWASVQKLSGPAPSHMVYNKAMGSSPFGGSEYFAYEGLIFEVVDGSHVASIVMFRV
ncbi:hypothetical protein HDU78_009428 [Chytriomyces hyalinus]|nr:hypothetical protein HDU78_009428 [Chytriomyces hyalinus]KAJ3258694.1 hypothetical protein HDU77_002179 [Chytriomyces hyalinus]